MRIQLAQAYRDQDRPVEAEAGLREGIDRGQGLPDRAQATIGTARQPLADLLTKRGHFAGAVEQLPATLELDSDQASVRAQLGSMLAELGRFDEAIATLTEAVHLDPELAAAITTWVASTSPRTTAPAPPGTSKPPPAWPPATPPRPPPERPPTDAPEGS